MKRRFAALVVGGAMTVNAHIVRAESFVIQDIEVRGLQRISTGAVFTYLPLKVGESFDESRSAQVIRTLYKTGFFDDVELRRNGSILIVTVSERPAISDIKITGNKDISTDQLIDALTQVGISKGRVFNRSVLERLERELRGQYFAQGKYNVKIDTTIKDLARNRVEIAIDISEGKVAKIRKITVVGNNAYKEGKLLDLFDSGVPGPFSFFSSRDEYSRQKLGGDIEKLRSYYLDSGYINFRPESTQVTITPDKKDIYVTVNVDEGEKFNVSSVKLAGDLILPEKEMNALVSIKAGDVFSRSDVTASITRLTERLGDEGYAFANVNAAPEIDKDNKTVALTLFVDPGERVYVRRINFHGNFKTRDEVLRREMRQMESGWYATTKVNRSKVRIQRLAFIESVNIQTNRVPGAEDQVDLDISVTERFSGSFTIGGAFTQSEGVMFNLGISQDNFLNSGKRMAVTLNRSSVNNIVSFSYTNPYYTVDGVSRGLNLFYRNTDASKASVSRYAADRYGASVDYGVPLTEYDFATASIGVENTSLILGDTVANEISQFVADNGDSYDYLIINAGYSHDTRNKTIFADKGNLQKLDMRFTAPGGNLEFYKLGYRNQTYFPLTQKMTLSVEGRLNYGASYGETSELPFFERYYAGGVRTVRGYRNNSLGPRDSRGDPYGGTFRLLGGAELIFPVPFAQDIKSFRMSAFVDAGNVFEDYDAFKTKDIRTSAGLGAIWLSPVGPLTFSLATALNDQPGDRTETFQFNIGAGF